VNFGNAPIAERGILFSAFAGAMSRAGDADLGRIRPSTPWGRRNNDPSLPLALKVAKPFKNSTGEIF
jgi:hypothetical protein